MNKVPDGKYVVVSCPCGSHLVDLFSISWNDNKVGFYECNDCKSPLVARGTNDEFYLVGERL